MRPPPDSARFNSPWHVDCRLETELPEDSIVGRRFIIHTLTGLFAAICVLLLCWVGYRYVSVLHGIQDWERRIADNREAAAEVERLRRAYSADSIKVDQAYALMKPTLLVHVFTSRIARTRPTSMAVDAIETVGSTIVVRGSLDEDSERASRLLGQYVLQLRSDEVIGPIFSEILISSLDRREKSSSLSFEVVFRLR